MATELSFQAPTTNTDGSAITEALSYVAFIDTVNPPVKSYAVPAANVAAAVAGLITVTFAQLGFAPVDGTEYFVDVVATDADGNSAPSASINFTQPKATPSAPTGVKIS